MVLGRNVLALKHSQGLPLDVDFLCEENEDCYDFERCWEATLMVHAYRLRDITIGARDDVVQKLCSFCMIEDMPNLRKLELYTMSSNNIVLTAAGHVRAPNLHELVLWDHSLIRHLPLLRTAVALRELDLSIDQNPSFTFDEFRTLHPPPLSLPNLAKIQISDSPSGCLALLRLFQLPDSCSIYLGSSFSLPAPIATLCAIRDILFMSTTTQLDIVDRGSLRISVGDRKKNWTLFPENFRRDATCHAVAHLRPLLASFAVTGLLISGNVDPWDGLGQFDAPQLLKTLASGESPHPQFPKLAKLRLTRLSFAGQSAGEVIAACRALWASENEDYHGLSDPCEVIIRDCREVGPEVHDSVDLQLIGVKLIWHGTGSEADQDSDEEL